MTIPTPAALPAPQQVLRSRALAPVQQPASEMEAAYSVEMRRAEAIAKCGDMLPSVYRGKPGAVMLASEFARTRGLDVLTVMQGVSFVQGKPIVDATLQRAMAERAGYTVRVSEVSADAATVAVLRGDELLGTETFTMDDAKTAGLTGKDNWRKNPRNMLVARATSNALRWYAPGVLLGVFLEDELDAPPDPVAVLAPAADTPAAPEPETVAEADVVDAVLVDQTAAGVGEQTVGAAAPIPAGAGDGVDPLDDLRARAKAAGLTQGDAIKLARDLAEAHQLKAPLSLPDVLASNELTALLNGVIAERMAEM